MPESGKFKKTMVDTYYNIIENKTAKLTIAKAQGNISSISDISKTYDAFNRF